jgi:RNA polymerase sigma-70 factor (ECF subfamily)
MIHVNRKYRRYSDEELMERLQEGEVSSFDELYRRYSRRLLHYFYRMLNGNEDKAQDFLQNICLTLIEKAHMYNRKGKFSSWLFTIASNMCKNEYRRNGKRVPIDCVNLDAHAICPVKTIEEAVDQSSFRDCLHKALYTLDCDKKNVFLLRFQEQCTIKEISQILGCAEGTVKSRLFYTIRYLSKKCQHFRKTFEV